MRILIVEDEPYVAEYIEEKSRNLLGSRINKIYRVSSLEQAFGVIDRQALDLCLLDLNLNGENGYDLLKQAAAQSFQTIIISAHTEQAIEAFQFGVLDFIPKPFTEERLKDAFDRFFSIKSRSNIAAKYLSTKSGNSIVLIKVDNIRYCRASGNYVTLYLANGKKELLDKKMDRLEQILPANFLRIHRSVIVDINMVSSYRRKRTGAYQAELHDCTTLPIGRTHLKQLKQVICKE